MTKNCRWINFSMTLPLDKVSKIVIGLQLSKLEYEPDLCIGIILAIFHSAGNALVVSNEILIRCVGEVDKYRSSIFQQGSTNEIFFACIAFVRFD